MLQSNFATVLFFLLAGIGFVIAVVFINQLVAGSHTSSTKRKRYESGEVTDNTAWVQFNARYYLFALLFVLFDVEAAFMLPWATAFRKLVTLGHLLTASLDALFFVFVLGAALLYAIKKGATKWV